jgi:hypothetical protein
MSGVPQKEFALSSSRKSPADIEFDKTRRLQAGRKAMSDYEADAAAVRAKTERLRALRLARDAAAPPPAPAKRAVRKAKSASGSSASGSLSDWLKDREDSGHKN